MQFELSFLDYAIIVGYFLIVFAIGFYFARKERTSTEYFLAGRHVGWFAVGASLFASNISTEHFIGLSGTGYASGLAVGNFEWSASICLLILGWVFVPFYLKSGVFTMPEFLERRYSSTSRWYLSTVSIIAYVMTKISVHLFAAGILLKQVMGWDMYTSSILLVVATGIYTIAGGMSAVIYTELIQTFILLIGAIALTWLGLDKVGGWQELVASVPAGHMEMFKPMSDPEFPWTGVIITPYIVGIWYWCTDQSIVQRVLAAKNIDQAKSGTVFAGFLKILPVFILILPGLIAYALQHKGLLLPGQTIQPNDVYPVLVKALLPVGFRGLIVASLLAALMASLAACFNSASTLMTIDIYQKFVPQAPEKKLVRFGQYSTVALVFISLLWVPIVNKLSSQLFLYLQSVQSYISPPIACVFLVGLLWPKANAKGSAVVLWTGFALGMARFILEIIHKSSPFTNPVLRSLIEMNFMHFAILLFLVSIFLLIVVSLATAPPPAEKVNGLTFKYAGNVGEMQEYQIERPAHRRRNVVASVLLLLMLAVLWLVFS
ncbi:sodium:solute symporter [Hymenobacter sp. HSC-4F20]|uniref:sodium:solute symporter n=1 Tax=Hymenobacter sp. HSC-4F20 TaxID=2864135 RepID=UPI001C73CFFA|nr:sodium:solute symporter [Hymenobacter sp. HSC-4F20]MBX0290280.1 sodium:solute symporter [Hymenobacter sp. HSC-4F20]